MTSEDESSEDIKTLTPKDYDVWMPLVQFNTPAKVKLVQGEMCSICLDNLLNSTPVRKIKLCKHLFHDECLTDWLKVNETCPNCKENLAKGAMQEKQRKIRRMKNQNKRSLKKINNTLEGSNSNINNPNNAIAPVPAPEPQAQQGNRIIVSPPQIRGIGPARPQPVPMSQQMQVSPIPLLPAPQTQTRNPEINSSRDNSPDSNQLSVQRRFDSSGEDIEANSIFFGNATISRSNIQTERSDIEEVEEGKENDIMNEDLNNEDEEDKDEIYQP